MINVENVQKYYRNHATGESIPALLDVNMKINKGEFAVLVGESGCGKSTLIRIIAGLLPASEGKILVDDELVDGPYKSASFVFQKPVLLPWKTAIENVLLPAKINKKLGQAATDKAQHLLELVGLAASLHRYPHELSGGMQQRVALARALFADTSIILLDEPFGAVDALTRERLNVDVSRIMAESGRTALMVTHSIQEAAFLGERVFVMSKSPGRITTVVDVPIPAPRTAEHLIDPIVTDAMQEIREALITYGSQTVEEGA